VVLRMKNMGSPLDVEGAFPGNPGAAAIRTGG
jgi:hypothetical protein